MKQKKIFLLVSALLYDRAFSHKQYTYCAFSYRLRDAWSLAAAVDSPDLWNELAEAALQHTDLTMGTQLPQNFPFH